MATVKGGWEVMIPPKKSASLTLKAAGAVDYSAASTPT